MERLKNFNFDEWRRRYMNWHKDNRARITDFFRRQDRDHDGKISREEFIEGILSSSKLSLFFPLLNSLFIVEFVD
jgi:dystonin